MTPEELISQLQQAPEKTEFQDLITVIEEYYHYTPTAFRNGAIDNAAGTNEGSCKLFAFAQIHQLTETETLALFGDYYRKDVLEDPNGDSHQNIRNFINTGWAGIRFENNALMAK